MNTPVSRGAGLCPAAGVPLCTAWPRLCVRSDFLKAGSQGPPVFAVGGSPPAAVPKQELHQIKGGILSPGRVRRPQLLAFKLLSHQAVITESAVGWDTL